LCMHLSPLPGIVLCAGLHSWIAKSWWPGSKTAAHLTCCFSPGKQPHNKSSWTSKQMRSLGLLLYYEYAIMKHPRLNVWRLVKTK
jgi:hypothetical protein